MQPTTHSRSFVLHSPYSLSTNGPEADQSPTKATTFDTNEQL